MSPSMSSSLSPSSAPSSSSSSPLSPSSSSALSSSSATSCWLTTMSAMVLPSRPPTRGAVAGRRSLKAADASPTGGSVVTTRTHTVLVSLGMMRSIHATNGRSNGVSSRVRHSAGGTISSNLCAMTALQPLGGWCGKWFMRPCSTPPWACLSTRTTGAWPQFAGHMMTLMMKADTEASVVTSAPAVQLSPCGSIEDLTGGLPSMMCGWYG
mmetsp:Transcript_24966/g.61782  ORF Transcript_24966/g.61782 Transcript_24966/m.61782 type:complete len:210 (-) Transcript_24966:106-735(-)